MTEGLRIAAAIRMSPPPLRADAVIIGGGFAGLALARELGTCHAGRVVVVEAGPAAGLDHYRWVNDPAAADRLWLSPETDEYFARPYRSCDASFQTIAGLRRRLGGRSLYWHGVSLPIEERALRQGWPEAAISDLTKSWADSESLYQRATAELITWMDGTPLATGRTVRLAGRQFTQAPRAVRRSRGGSRWKAYSPIERWSGSAEVYCDCQVNGLILGDGSMRGVDFTWHGSRRTILAPTVILAAGTIENSRLAIQALVAAGSLDEPQLTGLVDKVAQGFVMVCDPWKIPGELRNAARAGVVFMRAGDAALRSNFFLAARMNNRGLAVFDCYVLGEQLPGETGRVRCELADGWPWSVRVSCDLGPQDRALVTAQRGELQELHDELRRATGAKSRKLTFEPRFGSPDLSERLCAGDVLSAEAQALTYSFPLGSEQHEAGTLPLGGPLLGEDSQFRAVRGLFASGPCTFPRTGAANPVLTILALSARIAATASGSRRGG
jgi:choline dehydrogenase-like flavoprotein